MRNQKEWTGIAITKEVRQKLKELGKKGEKYSDVISRLLKTVKKA